MHYVKNACSMLSSRKVNFLGTQVDNVHAKRCCRTAVTLQRTPTCSFYSTDVCHHMLLFACAARKLLHNAHLCYVGFFWAHIPLWQMQRLLCWWLTCWLLTKATPAASSLSCTSSTAHPLIYTKFHHCSYCNTQRYIPAVGVTSTYRCAHILLLCCVYSVPLILLLNCASSATAMLVTIVACNLCHQEVDEQACAATAISRPKHDVPKVSCRRN